MLASALGALLAGCGDIVDVDVTLDRTSLRRDFGASAGTIPPLSCSADDDGICGALPIPAGIDSLRVGCDVAAGLCFGEADLRLEQPIAPSASGTLGGALERQAIDMLRSIDVAITVPTNTLSFSIGKIALFVRGAPAAAPAAVAQVAAAGAAATSDGDVQVGDLDPLAAGQIVTTARHVHVAEGSPAHAAVAALVRAGQPFALAVVLSPRVLAGSPVPGGTIEINLQPTLRIGVAWSQVLP